MFCVSSLRQENQDQLLHRVAGLRRPAGVGAGDALRRHRAGAPALDLRRDLLPGAHLAGRPADHGVHPAPVLHRAGQVRLRGVVGAVFYSCSAAALDYFLSLFN